MTENFVSNAKTFAQVRRFENLLFLAVMNGKEIPDEEMIRMRARIYAF